MQQMYKLNKTDKRTVGLSPRTSWLGMKGKTFGYIGYIKIYLYKRGTH